MRRRGVSGRVSSVLILFVLTVFVSFMALSEVRMPEASGKDVKKNGDLVIDCSHMDQGYVMVKSKKTKTFLTVSRGIVIVNCDCSCKLKILFERIKCRIIERNSVEEGLEFSAFIDD